MAQNLSGLFLEVIEVKLPHLRALSEERAAGMPASGGGWTCKEELGHLLDSAANNHIRFVLGGLGPGEFSGPGYAQDDWVKIHNYQQVAWPELVEMWRLYNRALARVVERIPEGRMNTLCRVGNGPPVTLHFVIEDYVIHMQHHLDHLLSREQIILYPQAPA